MLVTNYARAVDATESIDSMTSFDGTLANRFSSSRVNFSSETKLLSNSENSNLKNEKFNFAKFFDACNCKEIGQKVLHFPTIASTEDVFGNDNSKGWKGLVVVADQQRAGKGRKQNQWISPGGSLAASFGFEVDLGTNLQLLERDLFQNDQLMDHFNFTKNG